MKIMILLFSATLLSQATSSPVFECTDSIQKFIDSLFEATEEVESHISNPRIEVFLNIRKTLEGMINVCFNAHKDFSVADKCIVKLHPIWKLVDTLVTSIQKKDYNRISQVSLQIAIQTANGLTYCIHPYDEVAFV